MKSKEAFKGEIRQILGKDNVVIFPKVNKCLKNVIVDKELLAYLKELCQRFRFG